MSIMSTNPQEAISRIRDVYYKLNEIFFKFNNEITGILISTLSRENYLLIGPPGTAKTTLVYALSRLLNAKWFYRQLTKFTDLEEVIGPINIAKLLEGKVERIYANSIVDCEFALLDEIFNASSAILNTLLSILNERVIYDGDKIVPVKTWTVFGSSNRVPDEEELQALYDRFPLRVFTEYVDPDDTEPLMIKGWELRKELEKIEPLASMEDIYSINKITISYLDNNIKDVSKIVSPIVANYVEHVPVSNRTRVKVPLYALTYLVIHGFTLENINSTLLRVATVKILKYLIHNREQINDYLAFASAHLPEDLLRITELTNEAKALISNYAISEAKERVKDAYKMLQELKERWSKLMIKLFESEINELESLLNKLKDIVEER